MLDNNGLRYAGFALTILSLLAAVWLAAQGRWLEAAVMGGFVLGALLLATWRDRLPSLFTFLFTVVAVINALGYVLELWDSPFWYDEVVHVITPFVIVAALGWLLIKRQDFYPRNNPVGYVFKIVAIGIVIGLLWEGFEWAIGIMGTMKDTLIDLLMDTIGSALAAVFCLTTARRHEDWMR